MRHGVAFLAVRAGDGAVLLQRRPPAGLLGGMLGLPGTPWRAGSWTPAEARSHAPGRARWRRLGTVTHVFTHFRLELEVRTAVLERLSGVTEGEWIAHARLTDSGLPTLMAKAVALAEPGARAAA